MEIVAPAGSMSRLKAAVRAGAGEVYLGLKGFGARRNAENFNVAEFLEAIDYCHFRGTKVFLTLNTMMKSSELEAVYSNLKTLYEGGLDAVIVQDFGVFSFLKDNFPELEIHGSTQMTVANHVEANYLKKIGFKRVVLARELKFQEIKSIREKTDIELEIFVSGALCISYSGNCYLSSFIGGRSGNRGLCAQPCRKEYICEDCKKSYILSPKDQMLEREEIEKLREIGIESIKIEGRMKSEEYVYETVKYYSKLLGGESPDLNTPKIFNRGYGKGYFYKTTEIMNPEYASDFGYRVATVSKPGELVLEESLSLGDGVSYISKNHKKLGGTYINKIISGGSKVEKAGPDDEVKIGKLPKGTRYVYKTYSKDIMDLAARDMKRSEKKIPLYASIEAFIGSPPKLKVKTYNAYGSELSVELTEDTCLEKAERSGITKEKVAEKLGELGETTFYLQKFKFSGDLDAFLPFKLLKSMKREAVEKLKGNLAASYRRKLASNEIVKKEFKNNFNVNPEIAVCVSSEAQKKAALDFGIKKIYHKGIDVAKEGNLEKIDLDSQLASNLYQILENRNSRVSVDWNQNIGNSYALEYISGIDKLDVAYLSPELGYDSLKELKSDKVKKGIVIYGALRSMYIEPDIVDRTCTVKNESGDKFRIVKNRQGNTEVYFDKAMNLIPALDRVYSLGLDELRLDFTFETYDETIKILKSINDRTGEYNPYNFDRGVY